MTDPQPMNDWSQIKTFQCPNYKLSGEEIYGNQSTGLERFYFSSFLYYLPDSELQMILSFGILFKTKISHKIQLERISFQKIKIIIIFSMNVLDNTGHSATVHISIIIF